MSKKIVLNGLDVYLLAQKALYIPQYNLLVISDWHLGKLQHFRQEGIFVPAPDPEEEFQKLKVLIEELKIREIVFLGDLFHSKWNKHWDLFKSFIHNYRYQIQFILTVGNHDILEERHFKDTALELKQHHILPEGIVFSHEPLLGLEDHLYNIVGHIHPGCLVETGARQTLRLPCFHLEGKLLTMPAFGKYTGLHILQVNGKNQLFAIVGDTVIELK